MKKPTPEQIRQTRQDLGLSQDEFGAKIGVTGRTIRRWELGETEVPPLLTATLAQLAASAAAVIPARKSA